MIPNTVDSNHHEIVSLKEHFHGLLASLRDYVDQGRKSDAVAVQAALQAQEKATAAALAAQEKYAASVSASGDKAIARADAELSLYKNQNNEWRASLSDVINLQMPRLEIESRFLSILDKNEAWKATIEQRFNVLAKDIADLRESRSVHQGQSGQQDKSSGTERWAIALGVTILFGALSAIGLIISLVMRAAGT